MHVNRFPTENSDSCHSMNVSNSVYDTRADLYYKGELESLQSIFHFPEEVALRLSETEYELFYSVQPIDYVRHITVNVNVNLDDEQTDKVDLTTLKQLYSTCDTNRSSANHLHFNSKGFFVKDLIKRFNEVFIHSSVQLFILFTRNCLYYHFIF